MAYHYFKNNEVIAELTLAEEIQALINLVVDSTVAATTDFRCSYGGIHTRSVTDEPN